MAEKEGFEPSIGLYTLYSLSRGAPSATRPFLLIGMTFSRQRTILARNAITIPHRPDQTPDEEREPRAPYISHRLQL